MTIVIRGFAMSNMIIISLNETKKVLVISIFDRWPNGSIITFHTHQELIITLLATIAEGISLFFSTYVAGK